jgi:L-ascorbate 6-phosphate lactonase
MAISPSSKAERDVPYDFSTNDPFDRAAPIRYVVSQLIASADFMQSILDFQAKPDEIAIWFLGQNGFLLKDSSNFLIGIDLYLTDSCTAAYAHLPFRLNRQLPVFIEPQDLHVDVFLTTHSHQDHADPETIRRMEKSKTTFIGPYDSLRIYRESGVPESSQRLIHPGQIMDMSPTVQMQTTFALPTDATDLNHTGVLLAFANGVRFYNTGDTAYAEHLSTLLPHGVDICTICINGGFRNLAAEQAAAIANVIQPRVVIPCHYDMMVNNVGSPQMFRAALELAGSTAEFVVLPYYEPWIYRNSSTKDESARTGDK